MSENLGKDIGSPWRLGWGAVVAVFLLGMATAQAGGPKGGDDRGWSAKIRALPIWFPPVEWGSVQAIRVDGSWEPGALLPMPGSMDLSRYDLKMFTQRGEADEDEIDRLIRISGKWFRIVYLLSLGLAVMKIVDLFVKASPPSPTPRPRGLAPA